MKKLLLTLAAILCFGSALADDRPIDYAKFPASAREFITKNFAKCQVTSSMVDTDGEYTANLSCGAKIEFRANGTWKEIDCRTSAIPAAIIPAKIAKYVKDNYATASIVKIDIDPTDYEIRLSTAVELKFDLKGNFIRVDD